MMLRDRVYSNILKVYPNEFLVKKVTNTTTAVSTYSIPVDCYLGSKIKILEYSCNGDPVNYYVLDKGVSRERCNAAIGATQFYIREGSNVILNPPPISGAALRFTYFQKLPFLDLRRGKVLSVALDNVGQTITSLVLDVGTITPDDMLAIANNGYMTVVDKDGIVQMNQIPIASIDTDTGVVTLDGPFTFSSGQTISVGNWVCIGKNSTTHSQLDDSCERYLIAHCNWKIQKRDSSNDSIEANEELTSMLADIVEAYKDADEDVDYITILDVDYLSFS
jgi:hypothetical protein